MQWLKESGTRIYKEVICLQTFTEFTEAVNETTLTA